MKGPLKRTYWYKGPFNYPARGERSLHSAAVGHHAAPSRRRTDLFAVTGVGLLVLALALAAVLSIIIGARNDDRGGPATEFVGVTILEQVPSSSTEPADAD